MRSIESVENFWLALTKVIKQKFIPALFNDFQTPEELRSLIALPCKLGSMGIISLREMANKEYINLRELAKKLIKYHSFKISEDEQKNRIKNIEETNGETTKNSHFIARQMHYMEIILNDIAHISQRISTIRKEELSMVTYRIRCKMSYALLKSCPLCIRGSQLMNIKN